MTPIHTETYRGYEIDIIPDAHAERPDAWGDDNSFLVGFHRQFYVTTTAVQKPEEIAAMQKTHHVLPLEAYIHSGVVLALAKSAQAARFPDRCWDVSLLGAVLVSKKEAKTKSTARAYAHSLVETWNDYLSGNVYGYKITKDGELVESVWGYYGDYEKSGVLEAAREAAECAHKRAIEKHVTSRKAQIIHRIPLDKRQAFN
jgi:hypothetical protein